MFFTISFNECVLLGNDVNYRWFEWGILEDCDAFFRTWFTVHFFTFLMISDETYGTERRYIIEKSLKKPILLHYLHGAERRESWKEGSGHLCSEGQWLANTAGTWKAQTKNGH